MSTRKLGAAALVAVVACGGGQTRLNVFSTDWEDDGGVSIARLWQRLAGTRVPPAAEVVVGIAGHADKMIGLPLDGGAKWTFGHPLDARPMVAGGVVVGSGGGEAFALDASTGRIVWRRPTGGLPLLGAGDDGTVTVATFRRAGGAGSMLLAVTHDGQVVRQIETEKLLGVPAVLGGMAFVPWADQYVSVIDLSNGDEAARVTLREETSRVWTQDGALWFGGLGYFRFDDRIRDASKGKASHATVPMRLLPGTPKLMQSGYAPVGPLADAEDKARAYAKPKASDAGASIEDGRWYATYFRIAMGFDADVKGPKAATGADPGDARLAWVHLHGSDFIGGAADSGGIVLCDEQGKVTELDATTGGTLAETDLGEPVKACVVNVNARRAGGNPEGSAGGVKPFATQLADVVLADDPQLVIAQKLLLRELAALPDESATKALVDLASDPRTSPDLLAVARPALANRRNGATYMQAALQRHYDYLKDVLRAPPVGPLAHALGAMKEKAAAPFLAAHLFDPADTEDDVKETAAALAAVGGPGELPAMRQFFGMYRASAELEDMADAVVSVGGAIVALDPKAGRAEVETALHDPMTVSYARDRLGAALAPPPAHQLDSEPKRK